MKKKLLSAKQTRKEFEKMMEMLRLMRIAKDLKILSKIPEEAQIPLVRTLQMLPVEVYVFAVTNYIFLSWGKNEAGGHWMFSHAKGKIGFLWFNPILWERPEPEIAFTIAHEVAHAFNGHEEKQTMKGERETDRLAIKWLSKHYPKKELMTYAFYLNLKKNQSSFTP